VDVFNVLVAGVGGQGVLLTSKVIAESALKSGLDVKQSEVHGMAQRGGSVLAHVRFGEKVYSPVISEGGCDLLISFEPVETARYLHYLKGGASVVYNTRRIATLTTSIGAEEYPRDIDMIIASAKARVYPVDATSLALHAGDKRALNLVLLGAASGFLPFGRESIIAALEAVVPKRALAVNKKAFLSGYSCVDLSHPIPR
jgi:indolepyruvate ferredoxin oxidoreductase beta subunit